MRQTFLHRSDAPFSQSLWQLIDGTVVSAAKTAMAARKLINIEGPLGFGLSSLPVGEAKAEKVRITGTSVSSTCTLPLIEIRSEFSLNIRDVAAYEETGMPLDLSAAANCALDCSRQEDGIIFMGQKSLNLSGLMNFPESLQSDITAWDEAGKAADDLIKAITLLDSMGFMGPYSLALSPGRYNALFRRYAQTGMTELEHISEFITDGIVKTPAINDGGVVIAAAEPAPKIYVGQDLAARFVGTASSTYDFAVLETVALWLTQPKGICVLNAAKK